MEQIVSENIFLLEFVVDNCDILPCAIPYELEEDIGETCVSFKFFDNVPLNVCEEDFSPKRIYGAENENMKSGKSCLFAMSSTQANTALTEFNIFVEVFKKLNFIEDVSENKILIGKTYIPITKTFTNIINIMMENREYNIKETVTRSLKECYNIVNTENEEIGCVDVFLRISCFGKQIVTQFQLNLLEKSAFFSDLEGKSLYKYRKGKKQKIKTDIKSDEVTNDVEQPPSQPICTLIENPKPLEQNPMFDGRCADCNPLLSEANYSSINYGDDKDVFIIRIGKKNDPEGKKPKLELVVVTPKGLGKKYTGNQLEKETEFIDTECPGAKFGKGKREKDKGKKKEKADKKKKAGDEADKIKDGDNTEREVEKDKTKDKNKQQDKKKEVKLDRVETNKKVEKEAKKIEIEKNKNKKIDAKIEKDVKKVETDKNKDKKIESKVEKEAKKVEIDKNKDKKIDVKIEKEAKKVEIEKSKDKKIDAKIEREAKKVEIDRNKNKKIDAKIEKEAKKSEIDKNKDKEKKIKEMKVEKEIKKIDNTEKDKDNNKEKDNNNTMPSYTSVILMKADQEIKKNEECCNPTWCQYNMPVLPYSIPYTTCYSYDYTTCCYSSPSSCYVTWETPSNITLKCSKGKIRKAICC